MPPPDDADDRGDHGVLLLTSLVGGILVVGLTAATAVVYDAVAERDGVSGLDRPVLDQAIAWRSPGLDSAVTAFTDVGGTIGMPIIAVVALAVMVALWRARTPVVLMLVAAAGSVAMTVTGKHLVGRIRPPLSAAVPPYEHSPSFPSGHAINATVIIGMVVYLALLHVSSAVGRVVTVVVGGAFVIAIGLSRVFLGHHWLTDVVAAWLLGLAWLALLVTAHRLSLTVRRGWPART